MVAAVDADTQVSSSSNSNKCTYSLLLPQGRLTHATLHSYGHTLTAAPTTMWQKDHMWCCWSAVKPSRVSMVSGIPERSDASKNSVGSRRCDASSCKAFAVLPLPADFVLCWPCEISLYAVSGTTARKLSSNPSFGPPQTCLAFHEDKILPHNTRSSDANPVIPNRGCLMSRWFVVLCPCWFIRWGFP